jgi:hypothetical protein
MLERISPSILTILWLFDSGVRTPGSHFRTLSFCLAPLGFRGLFTQVRFASSILLLKSMGYQIRSLTTEYAKRVNGDIRGISHLKPLSACV